MLQLEIFDEINHFYKIKEDFLKNYKENYKKLYKEHLPEELRINALASIKEIRLNEKGSKIYLCTLPIELALVLTPFELISFYSSLYEVKNNKIKVNEKEKLDEIVSKLVIYSLEKYGLNQFLKEEEKIKKNLEFLENIVARYFHCYYQKLFWLRELIVDYSKNYNSSSIFFLDRKIKECPLFSKEIDSEIFDTINASFIGKKNNIFDIYFEKYFE